MRALTEFNRGRVGLMGAMVTLLTVGVAQSFTSVPMLFATPTYYAQFAESDDLRDNVMFRAPSFRHHVSTDETAVDMVERAARGLVYPRQFQLGRFDFRKDAPAPFEE